jgi:hypothetical protein
MMKKVPIAGPVAAPATPAVAHHATAMSATAMSDDRSWPAHSQLQSNPYQTARPERGPACAWSATRRDVLVAGAAAAFVAGGAAPADHQPAPSLYRLIADESPDGQAFAAEAFRLGAPSPTMAARIGDLWAQDLYFKWKSSAAAVAGLTPHHVWFLLDQMAAGAGLRTIYIAHHRDAGEGQVVHELFGPRAHLADRDVLDASGALWPRAAARLILSVPTTASMNRTQSTILEASSRSIDSAELVSWIIAPPQRT